MATSIIRCHPFSGTNEDEPPCYLLQVDDFHCLLDCGWDSKFSDNYVLQIAKYTKIIDAVFISHPDVRHMGALPFLVGKCGLNCPVYMTTPVLKMGHLSLYDAFLSISNSEDFKKFNLDNIDEAFHFAVDMKYQQPKHLHGRGQGVTVTPYAAGHMIGGAIWKIVKDDLEIVYAVDYNHKKENHLNGAIFNDIQRPHLLITSSYHALQKMHKKHKEEVLKQTINETLKRNGNILFLSDTAGRSLELSYVLEKMWRNQESGLMAYGLVFASTVATNVMEFAKSFVEWLSDDLTHGFESTGWKPFHFKYTSLCHDMKDIMHLQGPMVAVASQSHLNYGIGRELLSKWCENENNLIILTSRDRENCPSSELFMHSQSNIKSEIFSITMKEEPRSNDEDFVKRLTHESLFPTDQIMRNKSILDTTLDLELVDDLSSDDEDSVKMEYDGVVTTASYLAKEASFLPDENGMSSDGTGFRLPGFDIHPGHHTMSGGHWVRGTKRLSLVFPATERKLQWDTYGEHIDVKDPNFLNTAGSSYAMDVINQKLCLEAVQNQDDQVSVARRPIHDTSMSHDAIVVRDQIMSSYASGREIVAKAPCFKEITIKCPIVYQDFEGLADAAAIQQMVTGCKPQEIIIVGGSRQHSDELAAFCRSSLGMKPSLVHVPCSGQVVNCTKEGHIYQARMSDALVSSLFFQRVGKYELAWLDASLRLASVVGLPGDDDALVPVNLIPVLDVAEGSVPDHSTVFINEPKLSDLKQLLMKKGRNAEIKGGVLIVDNVVAVTKNEAGKLLLEGALCEAYFDVREVLYSQFAIL